MADPSGIAAAIESVAYDIQLVRICQLAGIFVALYDHVLTFDKEVELIWKKRWSFLKGLFLVNRYLGDFFLIADACVFLSTSLSGKFCYGWFRFQGFSNALIVWLMQVILQFRVYAMYGRSRKVLIFMLACFFGEIAATSSILAFTYTVAEAVTQPVPGVHICAASFIPQYFSAFWVPVITFETILFALALAVSIRHLREARGQNRWAGNRLLNVLLRDSIFYFFCTLTTYAACAVTWLTLPVIWLEAPEGFALGATCIMGSRLVLNIREAYYRPFETDPDVDTKLSAGVQRSRSWRTRPSAAAPDSCVVLPMSPISRNNDSQTPQFPWKWDEGDGRPDNQESSDVKHDLKRRLGDESA